ncbi:MAG: polymerase III subunit beta protein [Candidatus Shapirobacteria bacterium GW2011_GWE1_38_10]|uniref:Beta sliding clamp n=1 Tax=Candidatus Shapirobacteria bacterium GW2011_GWE1_38_10 TaxID=1618488 RepID=A0A0G0LD02_9BACT|nr:MAG: polymerase III subunit beta protein [Candidatus Shapirobacteria bacterium GW2011_GWF2_37_20]KKQ50526.1 MAG: polymerase III subunit beta protein [Candidatus Shapirobacteria bacterium GW2011_GWE1_38_10]KKQ64667.1 MAG: polymerase III subunit beta protein [Candidatus Shapirobacteria bacterium GW2011_GWF1_38_23]HBP51600.1 DNA polymerase III subunit beta [Candidatus Shapirobacteria bacterium]
MKLSLLEENLSQALSHTSRFVASKIQLPILNHILFSTDNGRLKLSATNLELAINYWLGAKIETEGSFCLPAKEITEFVSYLPAGRIDLSLKDTNILTLTSTKTESNFACLPPADFPEIPSLDPKTAFEIDLPVLTQAINQIAFAAATDDSRPVLTAILCTFSNEELTLVATDGFRLSLKSIKLVNPLSLSEEKETLLIPAKSLLEIVKLARNAKKVKIGLTKDAHQVVFVLEDLELVSRLIDGEYPDYNRIIPKESGTKIYLNRDEFAQAIKQSSVFARESANVVKISLKASSIELSANAPQIGQNKVNVDARIEGEALDIAFNYKFISDFLSICTGDEIVLELSEPLSPGLFRDQSDPALTHIIMPVRIQD